MSRGRSVRIGECLRVLPETVRNVYPIRKGDRMTVGIVVDRPKRKRTYELDEWMTQGDLRRILSGEVSYSELKGMRGIGAPMWTEEDVRNQLPLMMAKIIASKTSGINFYDVLPDKEDYELGRKFAEMIEERNDS